MKTFNSILIFVIGIVLLTGCIMNQPSVCDSTSTDDSVLCRIATEQGIQLEAIGNGLIICNALSISNGLYTKDDALTVLYRLRDSLDSSITYAIFKDKMETALSDYPGMMDVVKTYLNQLSLTSQITQVDKDILAGWLDNRIASLN